MIVGASALDFFSSFFPFEFSPWSSLSPLLVVGDVGFLVCPGGPAGLFEGEGAGAEVGFGEGAGAEAVTGGGVVAGGGGGFEAVGGEVLDVVGEGVLDEVGGGGEGVEDVTGGGIEGAPALVTGGGGGVEEDAGVTGGDTKGGGTGAGVEGESASALSSCEFELLPELLSSLDPDVECELLSPLLIVAGGGPGAGAVTMGAPAAAQHKQ